MHSSAICRYRAAPALVLAIAEGQACALGQQGSPPGGGVLQLGGHSGFLAGCQPPARSGRCGRSGGRCDEETMGARLLMVPE
jgi:hypothetical protein